MKDEPSEKWIVLTGFFSAQLWIKKARTEWFKLKPKAKVRLLKQAKADLDMLIYLAEREELQND